jgi:hypothetical protein
MAVYEVTEETYKNVSISGHSFKPETGMRTSHKFNCSRFLIIDILTLKKTLTEESRITSLSKYNHIEDLRTIYSIIFSIIRNLIYIE